MKLLCWLLLVILICTPLVGIATETEPVYLLIQTTSMNPDWSPDAGVSSLSVAAMPPLEDDLGQTHKAQSDGINANRTDFFVQAFMPDAKGRLPGKIEYLQANSNETSLDFYSYTLNQHLLSAVYVYRIDFTAGDMDCYKMEVETTIEGATPYVYKMASVEGNTGLAATATGGKEIRVIGYNEDDTVLMDETFDFSDWEIEDREYLSVTNFVTNSEDQIAVALYDIYYPNLGKSQTELDAEVRQ